MAIAASTISSTQTLEEFRLEFNKLQSDVSTLESNPTYGTSITFEGATADAYETTLTVTDPTADRTWTLPNATDTVVGKATTDTLTNKSIDLGTNTLTGSVAEFNSALQSESFATLTGSETLTNKTLTTPVIAEIDSGSTITLDATTDIVLDADGGDIFFKDGGTTFGSATNTSGDLIIKSGTTTALTFDGANVTFAGTVTIGSAGISEAELEILDGATVTTTELNLIDGGTVRGTTAVATGDGILINDAGTMRMTNVETVSTYFASHTVGGGNIVTTGALDSGSITSGFGTIDTGSSAITTTGVITGGTVEATTDTAASDNAAIGYTSAEGLILTGQGSTNDVTIKNDADADVITIATGATNVDVVGDLTAGTLNADGDTASGDNAAIGYTSGEGLILTGQGSTNDVTIKNDADGAVISIPTGTTNVTIAGDLTISGDDLFMGTNTSGAALIADGTNYNPVVISGDATIATNGALTIAATSVEGSMLNTNVISGLTALTSGLATTDEVMISDAGTIKRMDVSLITALSTGDATALAIALG